LINAFQKLDPNELEGRPTLTERIIEVANNLADIGNQELQDAIRIWVTEK